jgi:hypothetical protein
MDEFFLIFRHEDGLRVASPEQIVEVRKIAKGDGTH